MVKHRHPYPKMRKMTDFYQITNWWEHSTNGLMEMHSGSTIDLEAVKFSETWGCWSQRNETSGKICGGILSKRVEEYKEALFLTAQKQPVSYFSLAV